MEIGFLRTQKTVDKVCIFDYNNIESYNSRKKEKI